MNSQDAKLTLVWVGLGWGASGVWSFLLLMGTIHDKLGAGAGLIALSVSLGAIMARRAWKALS